MLSHGLWSNGIPRFVIDEDSSVELTKKVVAARPEFLQLPIFWTLNVLIFEAISLTTLISVVILFMRLEMGHSSL